MGRRRHGLVGAARDRAAQPGPVRLRREGLHAVDDRDGARRSAAHRIDAAAIERILSPGQGAAGPPGGAARRGGRDARRAAQRPPAGADHQGRPVPPGVEGGGVRAWPSCSRASRSWPRRTRPPTQRILRPAWGRAAPASAWSATRCAPTSPRCWSSAAPGVHVPYHVTWALEHAEIADGHPRLARVAGIREAPGRDRRAGAEAHERRLAAAAPRGGRDDAPLLRALLGGAGGRRGGDRRRPPGARVQRRERQLRRDALRGVRAGLRPRGLRRRRARGASRSSPATGARWRRAAAAGRCSTSTAAPAC